MQWAVSRTGARVMLASVDLPGSLATQLTMHPPCVSMATVLRGVVPRDQAAGVLRGQAGCCRQQVTSARCCR